jgi:hypothetical protein
MHERTVSGAELEGATMARSAEARKVLRELDKELESAARRSGRSLEWSAADRAVLGLISASFDRISDLNADYEACSETKLKVKLSTELRLLETAAARLLKQIKTDLPAPDGKKTVRARRAANARWDRENAAL